MKRMRQTPAVTVSELRRRLAEAEETLAALRSGGVDALIVNGSDGEQVYTLKGADHPYRVMIEQMQEGAATITIDGVVLYANRCFADILRVPLEKLIGRSIDDALDPADRKLLRQVRAEPSGSWPVQTVVRAADGTIVPCLISAALLCLEGRNAICLILTDLTEQKRSEENFRLMIENAHDYSFCMLTPRGIVSSWTVAAERLFGYHQDEIIGQPVALLHRGEGPGQPAAQRVLQCAGEHGRCEEEVWQLAKDGRRFRANVITTALHHGNGALRGFCMVARDVTERYHLERDLMQASAREQQRIGQDLHDSLGQQLTGLSYLTQALEQRLEKTSPEHVADIHRIRVAISDAVQQARLLAQGLCPVELGGKDFVGALEKFAGHVAQLYKVRCRVRVVRVAFTPDEMTATQIYQIIREAVINGIKHGRATEISVRLSSAAGQLRLTVHDNGVGLGKAEATDPGIGLKTMTFRARMLGGTLHVSPHHSGGTQVSCSFPIRVIANGTTATTPTTTTTKQLPARPPRSDTRSGRAVRETTHFAAGI